MPAPAGPAQQAPGEDLPALRVLRAAGAEGRAGRLVHCEHIAGREGVQAAWPDWVPGDVTGALARHGIRMPWSHQAAAACHARAGRSVIISAPAASGKSLGYLMPALTSVLEGGTALYVAPTKALAADQLTAIH